MPRGPRNRTKPTKILRSKTAWNATVPADLNPRDVLLRYLSEESTSHIAAEYGCTRAALTEWLRAKCPQEWKKVQILRALGKKEDGDWLAENAKHGLDVARARALVDSSKFELERLDQENYGQKQQVSIDVSYHIAIEVALTDQALQLVDRIRSLNAAVLQPLSSSPESGEQP